MNQNYLLIDCFDAALEFDLHESSGGIATVKFKGKFQEADAVNKNKRIYPYNILESGVKKLKEAMGKRRLVGELDHPADSIVHLKDVSHVITNLYWEGNVLIGEGELLNTPCGRIAKSLLENGSGFGISSRGVGNGKVNEDGILVIGEGYKLITFDIVADPSTYEAFQEKVVSKKNENYREEILRKPVKNESERIDKVNRDFYKKALVAHLGGVVKSHTEAFKNGDIKNG